MTGRFGSSFPDWLQKSRLLLAFLPFWTGNPGCAEIMNPRASRPCSNLSEIFYKHNLCFQLNLNEIDRKRFIFFMKRPFFTALPLQKEQITTQNKWCICLLCPSPCPAASGDEFSPLLSTGEDTLAVPCPVLSPAVEERCGHIRKSPA